VKETCQFFKPQGNTLTGALDLAPGNLSSQVIKLRPDFSHGEWPGSCSPAGHAKELYQKRIYLLLRDTEPLKFTVDHMHMPRYPDLGLNEQIWGVQKLGFVATFFAQLLALS